MNVAPTVDVWGETTGEPVPVLPPGVEPPLPVLPAKLLPVPVPVLPAKLLLPVLPVVDAPVDVDDGEAAAPVLPDEATKLGDAVELTCTRPK